MWINQEVDLPQALITAQRDGRLVIFAGAGVSMGAPSNLPSFDALTAAVAAGVLVQKPAEPLDAFLGRLELHGVDVQARTRTIIDDPTSRPRPLHEQIVRLFRNEDVVRLVTTNFDRHFTTVGKAAYPNIEIFTGPALPLGRDVSGVVYLHGAVEKPRSRLVLTDGDFGRAYLADGWATRFLMEMFREFTVLFVGYSHQDLVMRYLARSFMGATARFALTPAGNDDFWTNLGITPVHFPLRPGPNVYAAIDDALQSWSTTTTMGVLDHEARIARLVDTPPTPHPEAADYLRSVLGTAVTLRFFTERATRVEWLQWVETEGFLAPVVSTAPLTSDEGRLLAAWVADRFAVQHPRELLDFVRRHAATLNPLLCEAIAFRLAHTRDGVSADTLRLWTAALLTVPTTPVSSLTRLLRRCADAGDMTTAALLFRSLLRPQLRFEAPWPGDEDRPLRLSVEMSVRGEEHALRHVWQSTVLPNLEALHRELLLTITAYLSDASALLVAAGSAGEDWDPMSHRRAAIETHEQDHVAEDWGLLIDVARELIDWLVVHDPSLARVTIDTWRTARQPLLIRLGIYGIGRWTDLPPNEALALIEEHRWLYKLSFKHEVFELLARVFSRAGDDAQRRFIEYSMTADVVPPGSLAADPAARETRDYEQYNVAVWLRRVAPDSAVAAAHFDQLQEQNPQFGPRDHPDMDRWISAGFVGPNSPNTADDLLAMPPGDAAPYIATYQPAVATFRGPDRHGLLTVFEQAAASNVDWSLSVADTLVARQVWTADVWEALIGAWRAATLEGAAWERVLQLLDANPEIVTATPAATASFIERAMERRDIPFSEVERLERMGESLLPATDTRPAGVRNGDGSIDWLTSAINHPAGQIVESWLKALGRRITLAGDQWDGLPPALRTRFEALLAGVGNNAVMGRIIFASQAHFLFRADRAWTEAQVIPLFDWEADAARAAQVWDGFLTWGRWSDPLVGRMQPFIRQTFTRIVDLRDKQRAFSSALASVAAFSTSDPWHAEGWLFEFMRVVGADQRARWADEFGRYIESLNPEGIEALWTRWLSDYWQARITGVPHPLEEVERQAMVTWLPALRPRLTQAIDRILAAPPSALNHFAFYRLHQSGIAQTSGGEVGRLLRGLLPRLTTIAYDIGEVAQLADQAANHGADHADLLAIADEMARLGCAGAAELRDRANR